MGGWRAAMATGVVVAVLTAACGGGSGDDDDGAASGGDPAAASTTTSAAAGGATETPAFLADLDRVCTTQVGFGGLTAYEQAPGVHPVALFEDFRGEDDFLETSRQLPAGWAVEQDADYEDASELEAIQLVACADRVAESPTGIRCEFDDKDDGAGKVELELVDATYELKVYAATTGELVHEARLEAKETDCPFIATFRKGDTTFVDQPSDDEYIAALKPVVAPS